ncbi:hypothetical protein ACFQES_22955 [Nonomuraea salmonea]|uniref:hypothetical protein n=1 Tax=Nonomuraea salmonea TaxID=46181 RepID=UPI0036115D15
MPEEATTTPGAPDATAALTATRLSRSLCDQVGLRDSSLMCTSPNVISGVPPSPSVGASSGGSSGDQRAMSGPGGPVNRSLSTFA